MDPLALSDEKLSAILSFLVSFGYIDGNFDPTEQKFVSEYMNVLLTSLVEVTTPDPKVRAQVHARISAQLDGVFQRVSDEIEAFGEDSPRVQDGADGFVFSRLKVRCMELFRSFDAEEQKRLLLVLESYMLADGRVAPEEKKLRQSLVEILPPPSPSELGVRPGVASTVVAQVHHNPAKGEDHPFLQLLEHPHSPHPTELASQMEREIALMAQAMALWDTQRGRGHGRLTGKKRVADLPYGDAILDGYVYVQRVDPIRPLEIIVIGDLHGCYSCLKAALLQSDFFRRVWLHQWDPVNNPDVKLVFVGDYIDRGKYGFDGILRTVLQLFVAMPDHVFLLRGNHEFFVNTPYGVRSAVYPAEAISTLRPHVPAEVLEAYRLLFEGMPTSFLSERTIICHGGVPRDDTLGKWKDLSSLNDNEIRFQMMWSDPAAAEHIPLELQKENPRFSFGTGQFRAFMEKAGFQTMIRGHEKVDEGFKIIYNLGDLLLLNVFSAGGATNLDLPLASSYRKVTPMAVTLMCDGKSETAIPWPLDWEMFNAPSRNGFLRGLPELEFRSG